MIDAILKIIIRAEVIINRKRVLITTLYNMIDHM